MPMLKLSTIRTWLETFPEETFGKFNFGAPMGHKIEYGDVRTQFDFISLDKEDDIKRMRSTEYTGGFFNEGSFIEKALVDEAQSRLRYPPKEHGGPSWSGIIIDGNAPSEDHWLATMSGQVDPPAGASPEELEKYTWPATWGLYMQPPALVARFDEKGAVVSYEINRGQDPRWPAAENIENLPDDYYSKMLPAKSRAWIDSHLMNKVAFVTEGAPVWPMFRREYHVAREALQPKKGHAVNVSTSAACSRPPSSLKSLGAESMFSTRFSASTRARASLRPASSGF
jgi:hypothetical protein